MYASYSLHATDAYSIFSSLWSSSWFTTLHQLQPEKLHIMSSHIDALNLSSQNKLHFTTMKAFEHPAHSNHIKVNYSTKSDSLTYKFVFMFYLKYTHALSYAPIRNESQLITYQIKILWTQFKNQKSKLLDKWPNNRSVSMNPFSLCHCPILCFPLQMDMICDVLATASVQWSFTDLPLDPTARGVSPQSRARRSTRSTGVFRNSCQRKQGLVFSGLTVNC